MDMDANFKQLFDFKRRVEDLIEGASPPKDSVAGTIQEIVADIEDMASRIEGLVADVADIKAHLNLPVVEKSPTKVHPDKAAWPHAHPASPAPTREKPEGTSDADWALFLQNERDSGVA